MNRWWKWAAAKRQSGMLGVLLIVLCQALWGKPGTGAMDPTRTRTPPAAIRSITRSANNRLIGGRAGGSNPVTIEVWASSDNGRDMVSDRQCRFPAARLPTATRVSSVMAGRSFTARSGKTRAATGRLPSAAAWMAVIPGSLIAFVASNDRKSLPRARPYLWFARDGHGPVLL